MTEEIIFEKEISKEKWDQFLYVSLKDKDLEVGEELIIEIWSNRKLIKRTTYTVKEKEVCKELKFKRKCYHYKYLLIQLPWFSVIRRENGDPRRLRIVVKRVL